MVSELQAVQERSRWSAPIIFYFMFAFFNESPSTTGLDNEPIFSKLHPLWIKINHDKLDSIKGYAYTSKFTSGLNNVFFAADFGGDYRVLDTDYTNFAVVYSCTTILGGCLSF